MKVTFDYLDEFERGAKALYDKSEIDNVSDAYLRSLIQQIESK